MELSEIMNQIKRTGNDGLQKTASAKVPVASHTTEKIATTKTNLMNSLADVLESAGGTKTASAPAPSGSATNELVKIATTLASAEETALQKEASLYGAAVADGFMARLQQYSNATPALEPSHATLKTASADGVPTQAEFEKFASENPDIVKQAIDLGYLHGQAQVEQLKQAAFEKGYVDTETQINELQKTAAGREHLQKIASAATTLQPSLEVQLEKLAETPAGREKLAEIKRGYSDTMTELTKMADDMFSRGYNDTVRLLKAM